MFCAVILAVAAVVSVASVANVPVVSGAFDTGALFAIVVSVIRTPPGVCMVGV